MDEGSEFKDISDNGEGDANSGSSVDYEEEAKE
jgi:hypothetical protein